MFILSKVNVVNAFTAKKLFKPLLFITNNVSWRITTNGRLG